MVVGVWCNNSMLSDSKPKELTSSQQKKMMSLKELVRDSKMTTIPENYISRDREPLSITDVSFSPIPPTIDMNQLSSGEDTDSELQKLHSACKEWGLFQLVNHGVSSSLMEQLKHETEEFFELSLEEKMKFGVKEGDFEGYGTLVRSNDQKLDWGDRFYVITNPVHIRKPYLLPKLPSPFRDTMETYLKETRKIAMELLKCVARALKMEERKMMELFEDGMEAMRMTYYPPCPQPDMAMGLRPHSDATALTILNQINGVEGLQVKKDGIWFPVSFLPGAFIVNVGDVLEMMSNGIYKSIEHRAAVNSEKTRISIATFFNPKFEAEIGPETTIINQQKPQLFKRIWMQDYVNQFFSHSLNGKSNLDRMKIQTAHDANSAP